jgi:uncharacterized membrane protein YdbT with pleckstrin-like domain
MIDTYLTSLLGEDERILFTTRRHWTVLAAEIASETVLTVAVFGLITVLIFLPPPIGNPLWAIGYLLLLLPAASLLRDVAVWANRKYVVTTQRVIHVEGVLSKEITDSSLEKVNDVKLEQSFAGRILGYGTVEILTASELGASKFTHISEPIRFKTEMLNAKNRLGMDDGPRRAAAGEQRPRDTDPRRPSLMDQVNAQRSAAHAPAPPAPAAQVAPVAADIPALLRQLDELRQAGVLTEAEFQNKKAQLLARL